MWSDFSPIHGRLVQYFLTEIFPVPTQFIWVVNTSSQETQRLLDAAQEQLKKSGHRVDVTTCLSKPASGVLAKHQHVASLYQMILPKLDTPLVLTVEDDNLPYPGGCGQAVNALATESRCGALSGLYRSRMNPEYACAALATDRWHMLPKYAMVPPNPLRVGFAGAGFTLYRTGALLAAAPFHAGYVGPAFHGWDANLCLHIRQQGWNIVLHGAIKVEHHCQEVLKWCAQTGQPIA